MWRMAHPAMLDPTVVECKQHKHRRYRDVTKQTLQTLQNAASGLACGDMLNTEPVIVETNHCGYNYAASDLELSLLFASMG